MREIIARKLLESAALKQRIAADSGLLQVITSITGDIVKCYQGGGKVLWCGNGGSAADAQHLAAELSGRFYYDRAPLFSEALHVNTSYLTAVANDYGYEHVFSRMVEAAGKEGDVLIGFTTSGGSRNVLSALETARKKKMLTVGFCGEKQDKMKPLCDHLVSIPSTDTPRIQECHMIIGHTICELVEMRLFPRDGK